MSNELSPYNTIAGYEDLYRSAYEKRDENQQATWLYKIKAYIDESVSIPEDLKQTFHARSKYSILIQRLIVDLDRVEMAIFIDQDGKVNSKKSDVDQELLDEKERLVNLIRTKCRALALLYERDNLQESQFKFKYLKDALPFCTTPETQASVVKDIVELFQSIMRQHIKDLSGIKSEYAKAGLATKFMLLFEQFIESIYRFFKPEASPRQSSFVKAYSLHSQSALAKKSNHTLSKLSNLGDDVLDFPLFLIAPHLEKLRKKFSNIANKQEIDIALLNELAEDFDAYSLYYDSEILALVSELKILKEQVDDKPTLYNRVAEIYEAIHERCEYLQKDFIHKYDLRIALLKCIDRCTELAAPAESLKKPIEQLHEIILENKDFYKEIPGNYFRRLESAIRKPMNVYNWLVALIDIHRVSNQVVNNTKKDEMYGYFQKALYSYYMSLPTKKLLKLQKKFAKSFKVRAATVACEQTLNDNTWLRADFSQYSDGTAMTVFLSNIICTMDTATDGVDIILTQRRKLEGVDAKWPEVKPKKALRDVEVPWYMKNILVKLLKNLMKQRVKFTELSPEEKKTTRLMKSIKNSFHVWFSPKKFLDSVNELYTFSRKLQKEGSKDDPVDVFEGNMKNIYQKYIKGKDDQHRLYERYRDPNIDEIMLSLHLISTGHADEIGIDVGAEQNAKEDATQMYRVLDKTLQSRRRILKLQSNVDTEDYRYVDKVNAFDSNDVEINGVKISPRVKTAIEGMFKSDEHVEFKNDFVPVSVFK